MGARIVEEMIRVGRSGPVQRLRIDLHGISSFGPGSHHCAIRWEQIVELEVDVHGVTASSPSARIVLPTGVFGLDPAELAQKLEEAQSIFKRPDILAELMGPTS